MSLAKGSIPACAGEPGDGPRRAIQPWVYPRVCGGTGHVPCPVKGNSGLSPRVRGNLRPPGPPVAISGSIPACAGEPLNELIRLWLSAVYPRVCGGTASASASTRKPRGLSPRVRGNRTFPSRGGLNTRSIPACAGEPHPAQVGLQLLRVYPRVCGGTAPDAGQPNAGGGLSPRVRGNRAHRGLAGVALRSIPACAGEPSGSPPRTGCSGVYPRVCGGTFRPQWAVMMSQGLSPRVRGNPPAA